jgi:O-antigen/teichoic acid export membrane protein
MVTSPYLARVIGADGIGIHSYTYSIVFYFVIFGRLGIQTYGNREIAAVRDNQVRLNQTFSDIMLIHLAFSLVAIMAYTAYIFIFPNEYRTIAMIQGVHLIGQLLDISWLFFGLEKFKITVIRSSLIKLLSLIAIFTLIKTQNDLWKYVAISALAAATSESIIWFALHRYVKFVKPVWSNAKKHISPMCALFIPSIAVSIYRYMDKIMLGVLSTNAQVGFYENSENIISVSIGFISALGVVMLPRMSNMAASGDTKNSLKIIKLSMKFIMSLSLAMAFGIIGISSVFPTVFFGDEFAPCNIILAGLAVSIPFTAFANVLRTQYLIPKHYDKVFIYSLIIGAIVNIVMNYLMIPHFGAMGAVIGTICAEITVCLIQVGAVRSKIPVAEYLFNALPYAGMGIMMAALVFYIGQNMSQNVITLICQIVVGTIIYLVFTCLYLSLSKDELWGEVKKWRNSR